MSRKISIHLWRHRPEGILKKMLNTALRIKSIGIRKLSKWGYILDRDLQCWNTDIITSSHTQEVSQMANYCTKYHFLRYTCETILNYIDCFKKKKLIQINVMKNSVFKKKYREKNLK